MSKATSRSFGIHFPRKSTIHTNVPTAAPFDVDFDDKYMFTTHAELALILFITLTLAFIVIMVITMVVLRWYYRRMLEVRLKELQGTYEPGRIFLIENAGNEIVQVRPNPLSPPLSDQTEYNVVAGYLRDDRRGVLF